MLQNLDIHIRDPFVLPIEAQKKYYLYGTRGAEVWTKSATGLDYYTSADLENWEGPFPAFQPAKNFWADRNFWAPEVHFYRGHYYMFVTFKAEGYPRGTQILVADSPEGLFSPLSETVMTPANWECLDGTLYVDEDEQAWIVFCHEWVQVGDGEICATPLSPDLTSTIGETQVLFCASEAAWATELESKGRRGYVTDGPWMQRLSTGELIMLWSSFQNGDYAIGMAKSSTGKLLDSWQQIAEPLYAGDGGHCMVFRGFDRQLYLSFHRPNPSPNERPYFLPLYERDGRLSLSTE